MTTDAQDSVRGQVALVTGANRGIGLAIASALAGLGMKVLVGARTAANAAAAVAELRAAGGDGTDATALAHRHLRRQVGRRELATRSNATTDGSTCS